MAIIFNSNSAEPGLAPQISQMRGMSELIWLSEPQFSHVNSTIIGVAIASSGGVSDHAGEKAVSTDLGTEASSTASSSSHPHISHRKGRQMSISFGASAQSGSLQSGSNSIGPLPQSAAVTPSRCLKAACKPKWNRRLKTLQAGDSHKFCKRTDRMICTRSEASIAQCSTGHLSEA